MPHVIKLEDCTILINHFLISVVPLSEANRVDDILWAASKWIDVPLDINISEFEDGAILSTVPINDQTSFNSNQLYYLPQEQLVKSIQPEISIEILIEKFKADAQIDTLPPNAYKTSSFNWGTLLELHWHNVGFAPGGTESYIFPFEFNPVHFGMLRANWAQITILKNHFMD